MEAFTRAAGAAGLAPALLPGAVMLITAVVAPDTPW